MTEKNIRARRNLNFLLAIIIVLAEFLMYFKFVYIKQEEAPLTPENRSTEQEIRNEISEQKKQDQATMEKTASLVLAKDPAQCNLVDRIIDGVNYKTVCLNNIYLSLSEEKLDYGACDKLVGMSIDDCQRRVVLLSFSKEKSSAACDKAPEKFKSSCSDMYINFSAVNEKDPALCVKSSTPKISTSCQNNVLASLASQKETLECFGFVDSQVKSDCGNYLKGKESCVLIKNGILRNICSREL
jgi:hypothetical protein